MPKSMPRRKRNKIRFTLYVGLCLHDSKVGYLMKFTPTNHVIRVSSCDIIEYHGRDGTS
jgi:hypothetical protein